MDPSNRLRPTGIGSAGYRTDTNVKTLNAPVAGFQLAAPPTIDQTHTFFQSLRIWDGTQGKYQFLRDRLDPTLDRLLK